MIRLEIHILIELYALLLQSLRQSHLAYCEAVAESFAAVTCLPGIAHSFTVAVPSMFCSEALLRLDHFYCYFRAFRLIWHKRSLA